MLVFSRVFQSFSWVGFSILFAGPLCSNSLQAGNELVKQGKQQQAGFSRVYPRGIVVADHRLASEAGAEILRKGGNVVDAAVATAFALSVVRPESCGIGGGGFMVIWDAKKQRAVTIDYRERAPRKASPAMYRDPQNPKRAVASLSRRGPLAVAVPGTVAGLCYAVKHYGKLDLKTVLAPAIRLSKVGVSLDPFALKSQKRMQAAFQKNPRWKTRFPGLWRKYLNGGTAWTKTDRFHSPLRDVLERIASQGRDGFYKGEVAQAIVSEIQRGGGLLTLQDLAAMRPVVRKPLVGRFDGYQVVAMPPPSSGGTAMLEMFNTISAYERLHPAQRLERLGHNSPAYVHLLTEIMKHAFADRAEFLGDADFVKVPVERLIGKRYAERLAGRIDVKRTKPLKAYGRFLPVDDSGTSHFCVMDAQGNAVACTETINTEYGSWVVEPKFGIVLNNEMDDFSAVPGQPNAFGLIQGEANAIRPGKKPLSSMAPTILVKDGKAVFVAGASGGPRIISSTLQVLLNMSRFEMSPEKAVRVARFHHQWVPNTLLLEDSLFQQLGKTLLKYGHKVQRRQGFSASQAAVRTSTGLRGGSDPRKGGVPAGY
ncbi:MAG: gamma-glutamyltransferase [Planctomycetaceae bacterium]